MFFASVLPELLSGNTPISKFIQPSTFLLLFLIGYGLPVLVIREFSVRKKLGLTGIILLGLAYGVYNEGLLAKTLIAESNLPVRQFDNYGYFAGVNFPWTAVIGFWHAIASVLLPILFTYMLFPSGREKPWLGRKAPLVIAAVLFAFASFSFIKGWGTAGTSGQYLILFGLMVISSVLAIIFKKGSLIDDSAEAANIKPLIFGISTLPILFILSFMGAAKINLAIFFFILLIIVWFLRKELIKNSWTKPPQFVLFGIGLYIQSTIIGMLGRFLQQTFWREALVTGIAAIAVFVWWAYKIIRYYDRPPINNIYGDENK